MADFGQRLQRVEEVLQTGPNAQSNVVPAKDNRRDQRGSTPLTSWSMTDEWPDFYWSVTPSHRSHLIEWLRHLSDLWERTNGTSVIVPEPDCGLIRVMREEDKEDVELAADGIFNEYVADSKTARNIFIGRTYVNEWLLYSLP